MKYLKWAFGRSIGKNENVIEVGKVIEAHRWAPSNEDWDQRGGLNFTNEECSLRWMSRGDTLYEVEVPSDGEILSVRNDKTPGGILVANKIILKNPMPISEELLMECYEKSKLPLLTYFECIGLIASRGFYNVALRIIKDKVNMDNIDDAIYEFNDSIKPWHKVDYDCYNKVKRVLDEIKSPIDINLFIDKDPYIKVLSDDKVINLTGQSGSGKTTYAKDHFNSDEYVVIDTDDIFSDNRFKDSSGINKELGEYFRSKYEVLPNCGDDFDLIYTEILNYCKKYDKIIVIDCAQFHCIENISLLKGTLIVIRTCIDNCYSRTIERYKNIYPNYTEKELENYKEKKKSLFGWYKYTNELLEKIDNI